MSAYILISGMCFVVIVIFLLMSNERSFVTLTAIPSSVWVAIITGAFSVIIALLTGIHKQVNHNFEMQRQRIDELQKELRTTLANNITAAEARTVVRTALRDAREIIAEEGNTINEDH